MEQDYPDGSQFSRAAISTMAYKPKFRLVGSLLLAALG
jgi:hypothetical protein